MVPFNDVRAASRAPGGPELEVLGGPGEHVTASHSGWRASREIALEPAGPVALMVGRRRVADQLEKGLAMTDPQTGSHQRSHQLHILQVSNTMGGKHDIIKGIYEIERKRERRRLRLLRDGV